MTTVITIESNIPLPTRAALYTHALKVAKATGRKFVVREEGEEGARIWRKA